MDFWRKSGIVVMERKSSMTVVNLTNLILYVTNQEIGGKYFVNMSIVRARVNEESYFLLYPFQNIRTYFSISKRESLNVRPKILNKRAATFIQRILNIYVNMLIVMMMI